MKSSLFAVFRNGRGDIAIVISPTFSEGNFDKDEFKFLLVQSIDRRALFSEDRPSLCGKAEVFYSK